MRKLCQGVSGNILVLGMGFMFFYMFKSPLGKKTEIILTK